MVVHDIAPQGRQRQIRLVPLSIAGPGSALAIGYFETKEPRCTSSFGKRRHNGVRYTDWLGIGQSLGRYEVSGGTDHVAEK